METDTAMLTAFKEGEVSAMLAKTKRRPRKLRGYHRHNYVVVILAAGVVICSIFAAAKPHSLPPPSTKTEELRVVNDLDTILLPVPTRTIAKGERLGDVEFMKVSWPKNRVSGAYIDDIGRYQETLALTPLPKHIPVPYSAISQEVVDNNAVVEGIPEGMRAITVRVDAESSVEGWARSGNFVDVIVVRASADKTIGLESKIIAENVKILSAGQSTAPLQAENSAPPAPSTVTLLTNQEDALKIKTAANIGKLTFALRGKGDSSPATSLAMNQKKLLGGIPETKLSSETNFRGYAKTPEGKTFVLAEGSRWVRSENLPSVFARPEEKNESSH